jgi:hypothetical protein
VREHDEGKRGDEEAGDVIQWERRCRRVAG